MFFGQTYNIYQIVRSYLDPKGNPKIKAIMEQQMQSVADEIRVKVQYSGDRVQFAFPQLTTAGPSETGSNEESNSRAWFNKIQTFRKSVIEGKCSILALYVHFNKQLPIYLSMFF